MKDNKFTIVRLKSDKDFLDTKKFIDRLNNPDHATGQELLTMFGELITYNIVLKNQEFAQYKVTLRNIAHHLAGKIFLFLVRDLKDHILTNHIFFPSICEILKAHQGIFEKWQWKLEKLKIISEKSINYYESQKN